MLDAKDIPKPPRDNERDVPRRLSRRRFVGAAASLALSGGTGCLGGGPGVTQSSRSTPENVGEKSGAEPERFELRKGVQVEELLGVYDPDDDGSNDLQGVSVQEAIDLVKKGSIYQRPLEIQLPENTYEVPEGNWRFVGSYEAGWPSAPEKSGTHLHALLSLQPAGDDLPLDTVNDVTGLQTGLTRTWMPYDSGGTLEQIAPSSDIEDHLPETEWMRDTCHVLITEGLQGGETPYVGLFLTDENGDGMADVEAFGNPAGEIINISKRGPEKPVAVEWG